ncbi:MAG TPA: SdrD B-like domain-containing protein [Candidatus Dormibacteraeota bacterium]|nr:SdrD B-like domain-containing protein [Candidatus Dormibacteraeota bacterium]
MSRPRRTALVAVLGLGVAGAVLNGPATNLWSSLTKSNTPSATATVKPQTFRFQSVRAAALAVTPPASTPRLQVLSARDSIATTGNPPRSGDPVAHYKWLLNRDTTGDPTQGKDDVRCHPTTATNFPDGNGNPADTTKNGPCPWPSIYAAQASPVLSEGDETNWSAALALPGPDGHGHGLGPGKYLVSVTSNGYEIGGAHFEIKSTTGGQQGPGLVAVGINPFPLPLGTVVARAFSDTSPTQGMWAETDPPLAGFHPQLVDFDGVVSVDYYGNQLCTQYVKDTQGRIVVDAKGTPTPIAGSGGCLTGADGIVTIPNMAPGRYGVSMVPPQSKQGGQPVKDQWIQTTTLEGNHDFDVWLMPNETGVDTEQVVAGEPQPFVEFGFVPPTNILTGAAGGEIKGQLMGSNNYVPGIAGLTGTGGNSNTSGIKLDRAPKGGWVALSNLNAGTDGQLVYAAPANADGTFDIKNVPDGDYSMAIWDQPQDYLFDQFNVTVAQGQVVDTGVLPLLNWFTRLSGHVFIDLNGNGRQDAGEPGLPKFTMQNLNRTNNTYEQGQQTADTDKSGYYEFTEAYPLGQFNVAQFFNTRYKTTGVTYHACNDKQEHTVITPAVDLSYLPVIGQCGVLDVGVQPYNASNGGDNGGIVATVFYDSIRVASPARQTVQFSHMTGIPGLQMDLYDTVACAPSTLNTATCKPDGHGGGYVVNPDGSYKPATPAAVQSYITENYGQPTGCTPLNANGVVVDNTVQDSVGIPSPTYSPRCIESAITGVSMGGGTDNKPAFPGGAAHGIQTVDGNYGLDATDTSLCGNPGLPADPTQYRAGCFQNHTGDFLVHVNTPTDNILKDTGGGYTRPLFTVSKEEDVNIASGDQWVPQGANTSTVAWPPQGDPARQQPVGSYPENPGSSAPGPDTQCAGPLHTVHVTNPDFLAIGGSPFEGQARNTCDTKLIRVQAGQSVAPNFHVHTVNDVPIPGKFSGYIVDDVSTSTDRKSITLGDVQGIAGVPVGVYDWAGNLQYTTTSDYNGIYEALMPSTQGTNCLTPSGVCPNVYRFVGNDPGQFPSPNQNYNPAYRTIAANFQSWPGQFLASDLAPTKAVTNLLTPGAAFKNTPQCAPAVNAPQIFSVDQPYRTGTAPVILDIKGQGFGATRGTGRVTLDGTTVLPFLPIVNTWSDHEIRVTVPGTISAGPHQLDVTNNAGLTTAQGLTYHVLKGTYQPTILTVGPSTGPNVTPNRNLVPSNHRFTSIQAALEFAAGFDSANLTGTRTGPGLTTALIVVYPANPSAFTPIGTYYENLIIHSPVKLQGVGPGGVYADNTAVQGTRVDGAYFWSTSTLPDANGAAGTSDIPATSSEPYAVAWLNRAQGILDSGAGSTGWDGNRSITEGQVVYVVAKQGQYTSGYRAAMDGFSVTGGNQKDFPGNINEFFGKGAPVPEPGAAEVAGTVVTQGGGFLLNAYADNFQISNDLVQGNSGTYGGAIRVGTPLVNQGTVADGAGQTNSNVLISHNQILSNGGTNLAGAIGIFSGSNSYQVTQNVICGNYSLEYGGGISHVGLSSPTGRTLTGAVIRNNSRNLTAATGAFTSADIGRTVTGTGIPGGTTIVSITSATVAVMSRNATQNRTGLSVVLGDFAPAVIDNNRIKLNGANDEGGGIMIAGELVSGGGLSPGAGPVQIHDNYIGSNISDDDGGGIRYLMAGTAPQLVRNNHITNNVSAHEGGGISVDDAPNLTIDHNTIARNVTTATAVTSNGAPAPAGISTARNSDLLRAALPGHPAYSPPTITNDIIWDNRAGSWASGGVAGIGLPGDTTPVNVWDVGTADGGPLLAVSSTYIDPATTPTEGYTAGPGTTQSTASPFTATATCSDTVTSNCIFVTNIDVVSLRTYFRFRPSAIVTISLPANAFGDYRSTRPEGAHIPGGAPQ